MSRLLARRHLAAAATARRSAPLACVSRWLHTPSFATVSPQEISGSNPAEVHNFVQGSWTASANWNWIVDPLNGEKFIKIAEINGNEIKPFVESLSKCPKHGLHNPLKAPERYLMYGDISAKAAHMLGQPAVSDFFAKLIQRVSPKSYQQALAEVQVSQKFLENFCGDQVRFLARSFAVPGNHLGQRSNGYRWPYGPVAIITPFNFPLEIPLLQVMGALYMGNKPVLKVDSKVSVVMEQMLRLLHDCGLPAEDMDFINSDGDTMNKLLLEANPKMTLFTGSSRVAEKLAADLKGRVKLEDAGFDWKILGPDVQEVDYIAWVCDQDAYACSGQKCSAQSVLFMHKNWSSSGLLEKMKKLSERRKLESRTLPMAIPPPRIAGGGGGGRKPRVPPLPPARTLLTALAAAVALAVLCLLSSSPAASLSGAWRSGARSGDKYLYWGGRVDCPGKHCGSCAGLGHQESSLRCALEEALFLGRVFVMPSRMCLSSVHNTKGVLQSKETTKQRWEESSCAIESLYDIDQISRIVPVILDNSKTWHDIVSKSVKLEVGGVAHVQGISRGELKQNPLYSAALIINRTASPLAWFMECKDRKNRTSVMLSYTFLLSMPAKKLRDAANKMKEILGDYDAIHVRRGDLLKNRKDRFGVERSLHPHLDRDTRPEYIRKRIVKWIPPGRTLYIASNERTPGFFSSLSDRYKLAYSSNFSSILEPVIENNYQLFMVERLIMQGAKTFVKTMREFDSDLTLCDDPKKNTKVWQRPVYTDD